MCWSLLFQKWTNLYFLIQRFNFILSLLEYIITTVYGEQLVIIKKNNCLVTKMLLNYSNNISVWLTIDNFFIKNQTPAQISMHVLLNQF